MRLFELAMGLWEGRNLPLSRRMKSSGEGRLWRQAIPRGAVPRARLLLRTHALDRIVIHRVRLFSLGLLIAAKRIVELFRGFVHAADVVVRTRTHGRRRGPRGQGYRLAAGPDRLRPPVGHLVGQTQVAVSLSVVRIEFDGLPEQVDGGVEIAGVERLLALMVDCLRTCRIGSGLIC